MKRNANGPALDWGINIGVSGGKYSWSTGPGQNPLRGKHPSSSIEARSCILSLSGDDYSRCLVVLIGALVGASPTMLYVDNCERPALDWGINIEILRLEGDGWCRPEPISRQTSLFQH